MTQENPVLELGSIEREMHVAATPEVVYEVLSRPEHLREWWPDDAELDGAGPGARGVVVFGERGEPGAVVEQLTVVEARPHRTFSFRWTHPAGVEAAAGNSLLVTFELEPAGSGTRVRMTETGFRQQGWEIAVLEQRYAEHVEGWDWFLPRLEAYAARLAARP
ncbi:SRPBCC family protein [Cellulomonas sp. Marseille-Q8402]